MCYLDILEKRLMTRLFVLVDLWDRGFRVGDGKSSENDQLTGHFQSWSFSELFFFFIFF